MCDKFLYFNNLENSNWQITDNFSQKMQSPEKTSIRHYYLMHLKTFC